MPGFFAHSKAAFPSAAVHEDDAASLRGNYTAEIVEIKQDPGF